MKTYRIIIELKVKKEIDAITLQEECDILQQQFADSEDYELWNVGVSWEEVK